MTIFFKDSRFAINNEHTDENRSSQSPLQADEKLLDVVIIVTGSVSVAINDFFSCFDSKCFICYDDLFYVM